MTIELVGFVTMVRSHRAKRPYRRNCEKRSLAYQK